METWIKKVLINLTFFECLKAVLITMVTILMMPAKLAFLSLLKIKVFWNKGYDVVISVNAVSNKILLCDSNYIVDVSCDQGLVTLSFHNLNFIKIWPEKRCSWFKFKSSIISDWYQVWPWNFTPVWQKG